MHHMGNLNLTVKSQKESRVCYPLNKGPPWVQPLPALHWFVYVNLTQTRVAWEEGTSVEEPFPSEGLWECL